MRRNVISAAAAAAAAIVLFGVASGSAAVNNAESATTLAVIQTTTSMHVPPDGITPGSTITFTANVTAQGRPVGTSQAACVIVAGTSAQCQGTTFTRRGQIQAQGPIDIAKPSSTVAIVGGTGAYKSAHGFITRKRLTATTIQETYHVGS
jgi:Dirigent-like protein